MIFYYERILYNRNDSNDVEHYRECKKGKNSKYNQQQVVEIQIT